MNISEKLKKARQKSGLTQEEVAEKINTTRQSLSNWENGKFLPDIVSTINLCNLYQISLDDLLKEDSKFMEKIKRDSDKAKANERVILTTTIITIIILIIYGISIIVGGAFYDFCNSALLWVLIGLSIAFSSTYYNNKEK